MPPDVADFTGRMATVTGWGRLKYGGGVPSVLQEVQVSIFQSFFFQLKFLLVTNAPQWLKHGTCLRL